MRLNLFLLWRELFIPRLLTPSGEFSASYTRKEPTILYIHNMGVSKNRGFSPKMDGENKGSNPIKIPWIWGGFTTYFWKHPYDPGLQFTSPIESWISTGIFLYGIQNSCSIFWYKMIVVECWIWKLTWHYNLVSFLIFDMIVNIKFSKTSTQSLLNSTSKQHVVVVSHLPERPLKFNPQVPRRA